MKTSFLFLALLLLGSACSSHQKRIDNPFYWKTTFQGKNYHFLGTMHVGFGLHDLPDEVITDLNKADLLAVEVTEEMVKKITINEEEKLKQYFSKITRPYPELKNKVSENAWKHLSFTLQHDDVKKFLEQYQFSFPVESVHPGMVYILTMHFAEKGSDYVFHPDLFKDESRYQSMKLKDEFISIMDLDLMTLAKKKDIPVIGLDSEQNLKLIMSEVKGDFGLSFIENFYSTNYSGRKSLSKLQEIQNIYRSGNEEHLEKYLTEMKDLQGSLIINRNKHWFDQLIHIEAENIFIAVGALHMVGENSLLKFFEDRGAKVERVKFQKR